MPTVPCAACGNPCRDGDRFCSRCGTPRAGALHGLEVTLPPAPMASHTRRPRPVGWVAPDGPLLEGSLFAGRYRIRGILGQGGMGSVYAALDETIEEMVALKVLSEEYSHDREVLDQFKRELKLARKVRQRNVVQGFDLGFSEGLCYISMEYIDAENLKSFLERVGPVPEVEALHIMKQVLRGLKAAHDTGVIHRDIKSQNVLVNHDRMIFITDFGLATPASLVPRLVGGTPIYMAPEQFQRKPVVPATDLYSCGILLSVLLTGRPPFGAEGYTALRHAHLYSPPEPVPEGCAGRATRELIAHLLRKHPATRPQGASEVIERINAILAYEIMTVRSARPIALVVAEDPATLRLCTEALEEDGHHVLTATAAPEAVKLAFENELAVIVLDSGVRGGLDLARRVEPAAAALDPLRPGVDGLGFCRVVKADEKLKGVPLVVAVDREQGDLREAFGQMGVPGLLAKPFERAELSRIVRAARSAALEGDEA